MDDDKRNDTSSSSSSVSGTYKPTVSDAPEGFGELKLKVFVVM